MADESGTAMVIVMVISAVVSLIFMSLRFYCKSLLSTKVGLDDIVLAFSYALFVVFIGLSIQSTKYGLGKHAVDLDFTLLPDLLHLLPIGQFFAVLSVAVSKSSFILTLLRLVTQTWQKAALWFMLVTINGSMLSIAIVQFFQCNIPPKPGCVAGDVVIGLGVFSAGYSAAMDLVLTAFPSVVIWKLQMRRREKFGIIISMSLGIVAGVVGIYKSSTIPFVSRSTDFTHGTAIVLIWLVAEVTATIIAASIPFYRPLIRRAASSKDVKESYGMTNRSRTGGWRGDGGRHTQLGSQADVKGEPSSDYNSDKDILQDPPQNSMIIRKTNITVEYDERTAEEGSFGDVQTGQRRRDMF